MKFIKRNKVIVAATALMVIISIGMAIQDLNTVEEILWNGKIVLPLVPLTYLLLGKTIIEFVNVVKECFYEIELLEEEEETI